MTELSAEQAAHLLGQFNIDSGQHTEHYTRSEKWVFSNCMENNLNTEYRVYDLNFLETPRSIDIGRAFIRIKGSIISKNADGTEVTYTTLTTDADGRTEIFNSGWIYSAFQRANLLIGGREIETNNELAMTMEMKSTLGCIRQSLVDGIYSSACLWDHNEGDTFDAGKNVAVESVMNHTECLNPDGSYEFLIPLKMLFETIKTLPCIYKQLFPTISLMRSNTDCVGITSSQNIEGPYNALTHEGCLYNKIKELGLWYPEYEMEDVTAH